jgi:hypothetical protein
MGARQSFYVESLGESSSTSASEQAHPQRSRAVRPLPLLECCIDGEDLADVASRMSEQRA